MREIGADQQHAAQLLPNHVFGENVLLHQPAFGAPVGGEIDHNPPALLTAEINRLIEVGLIGDYLEAVGAACIRAQGDTANQD